MQLMDDFICGRERMRAEMALPASPSRPMPLSRIPGTTKLKNTEEVDDTSSSSIGRDAARVVERALAGQLFESARQPFAQTLEHMRDPPNLVTSAIHMHISFFFLFFVE